MPKSINTLIAVFFFMLLMAGCSSDNGGAEPPNPDVLIDQNAFNSFTNMTFADSTCQNLPLTSASGVFAGPDGSAAASGSQDAPLDLAEDDPLRKFGTFILTHGGLLV